VAQHPQRWTLLHLAAAAADFVPASNGKAMLAALLAYGADASRLDSKGQAPVFLAVAADRQQLVSALLEASPNVLNQRDAFMRTPLHHAAFKGAVSVVKVLLKHGAILNVQDDASKTPMDYAKEEGHAAIIALLTPRDPNEQLDFKLPPGGGLVEGGEQHEPGNDSAELGLALGVTVSFILLCCGCACARRRRAKVARVDVEPPKILVDPMSYGKESLAIVDTEESLGPRLGAVAETGLYMPQPPKVPKRVRSKGKKKKSSEDVSELALCVVEATPVVDIQSPSSSLPSPRRHSHSPSTLASQRRSREREMRRSRSQIYSTKGFADA
jgi:hypothetical protein